MSLKGGYKLIDLKENNFTVGVPLTIKGIYDSIERSYNKSLILTGIVVSSVERNDVSVNFVDVSGNYESDISSTEKITVTNTDAVTISNKE